MSTKDKQRQLVTTARIAGVWYLLMAITGIVGFMMFHTQVFDPEDSRKTLTNLTDTNSLARVRILLEFGIIVSQALTAIWFYKLFKHVNEWAAWTVGIWGMVNAVAIMISAISMGGAIEVAHSSALAIENKIVLVELLSAVISNAWGVGSIFFGLWLIPMGYIVVSSKRMPLWLGWTLIIGGAGYLLSVVVNYLGIESSFSGYLVIPATIGEFWMIGYLLVFGIRPEKEE